MFLRSIYNAQFIPSSGIVLQGVHYTWPRPRLVTLYLFLHLRENSWQPIRQPGRRHVERKAPIRNSCARCARRRCLTAKRPDFSTRQLPANEFITAATRIFRSWCNYSRDLIRPPVLPRRLFSERKINLANASRITHNFSFTNPRYEEMWLNILFNVIRILIFNSIRRRLKSWSYWKLWNFNNFKSIIHVCHVCLRIHHVAFYSFNFIYWQFFELQCRYSFNENMILNF